MRMTRARRKSSPSPGVDRMHFVMWDFLKMFLATVMCGVAVSLAAAGIALLLANDAYAAALSNESKTANLRGSGFAADEETEPHSYPGVLMPTSGCDADKIEASDRDWKVTVNGNYIDVRVMQTFIVPEGDASAATFSALLPAGARLLRLNVHTIGHLWLGKVFDAKSYDQLTAIDFRNITRGGMLIVQNDHGAVLTDAIVNIAAAEAVTVEYTYRLTTENAQAWESLFLTLVNDNSLSGQAGRSLITSGDVWVEWVEQNPRRLIRVPSGAFLETAGAKITGLSWRTDQLDADTRFQLAWSM